MSFRGIAHCLSCGRPLHASRLPYIGDDCAKKKTPAQLEAMAAYAAHVSDPFYAPDRPRPLSAQGRINNLNARRAAQAPDSGQLCRHEGLVGACAQCTLEANPWRAATRILREVLAEPFEERRLERVAVQSARRERGVPAPAKRPAPRPRLRRPAPTPKPADVQLELI